MANYVVKAKYFSGPIYETIKNTNHKSEQFTNLVAESLRICNSVQMQA